MPYASGFRPGLFEGSTILVAGGGGGLGRCIAHELASLGADLVLAGRTLARLERTRDEIVEDGGHVADCLTAELRDGQAVVDLVARGEISRGLGIAEGSRTTKDRFFRLSARPGVAVKGTSMKGTKLRIVTIAACLLVALPAVASDGVFEIDRTCTSQTGCFPGDAPVVSNTADAVAISPTGTGIDLGDNYCSGTGTTSSACP